ncbi:MAG TPA: NADH-quinone oxidoreductase subunit M [Bacteroidia bacterium]|jgi:NADH-quinone oxidoreductase subunit M|nr:NADH-quinone oxidoreductase subunit M [Bacteroidia bacterium]
MITASLIGLPLVFALLLLFTNGEGTKRIALVAAMLEFGLTLFAYYYRHTHPADEAHRLWMNVPWITSMGISFNVALDGISLVMVMLTTFLVPLIILSGFKKKIENPTLFYSLILFMEMALVGVFLARDGFLFYVFWELALIPIYFICLMWGGENRGKITFKFFVYTLFGSLFMLAALIYLYLNTSIGSTGIHTFDLNSLYEAGHKLTSTEQSWVFWGIFLAFAIKMPIFPFHTWQPDTYVVAPTQGTMLLSGIMLKMGTYGLIRWLLPMTPLAFAEWGHVVVVLCVVSVIYASCMAIVQKDFKRLIAYSSIAHVGLIAAGIMAFSVDKGNVEGLSGAIVQMFSHGVNVVGLFFVADLILSRTGTNELDKLGGIRNVSPQFTSLFMIIMLGSVALPLTNGFIGEFLLINGIYQYGMWTAIFAGLTIILGAVYMLRSFQAIMLGEVRSTTSVFPKLETSELAVLLIVCAAILLFGIFPKPILGIIQNDIQLLVSKMTVTVQP